ncbi:hypothetical protein Ddc_19043 [Ditylenchus destructor]|nr:hypothetical protein Ddc_19043 [Ditylenchus destructor]
MTEVVSMITDKMDATFPTLSETAKTQDKKSKSNGRKPDPKKKVSFGICTFFRDRFSAPVPEPLANGEPARLTLSLETILFIILVPYEE